jgi:hypothetical protein
MERVGLLLLQRHHAYNRRLRRPAPATALGKIFTILYIFVGLGVIGGFINVLAKHTFARQRRRGGLSKEQEESEGEAKEGAPRS